MPASSSPATDPTPPSPNNTYLHHPQHPTATARPLPLHAHPPAHPPHTPCTTHPSPPQNILLDKRSAEVVHIDLGIAFEQGRFLNTPELVPFRLTQVGGWVGGVGGGCTGRRAGGWVGGEWVSGAGSGWFWVGFGRRVGSCWVGAGGAGETDWWS